MTCRECRELLFAFLDNELDAMLSIEVQRHLEHCCACAREAEIEFAVRKRLEANLQAPSIPALDEAKLKALLPDVPTPERRSWRYPASKLALAGAALLALGLLAPFAFWLFRGPSNPLSLALVDDLQRVWREDPQVQIASSEPQAVSDWLRERTGLSVKIPPMHGHKCKLIGARKCTIEGRTAALALYDMDGTPVSWVALERTAGDLDDMQARAAGYWSRAHGSFTLVAAQDEDMSYFALGTLSEDQLLGFIRHGRDGPSPRGE